MDFYIIRLQILRGISFLIFSVNFLEIVFLLKTRKRWLNAHILVLSLALADTTLGFTTAIIMSFRLSHGNYKSLLLTLITYSFFYGNMCGSVFIVIFISVDRWIAVKWPFRYRSLMTKNRVCIGTLSALITGVIIVFAVFVFNTVIKTYSGTYILGVITITCTLILMYLYLSIFLLYRKTIRMVKVDRGFTGHCESRETQRKNSKIDDQNSMESKSATVSLSPPSCDSTGSQMIRENKYEEVSEEVKKRIIRMSDKEKRLLKFCLAIVICFVFSYLPLGLLIWLPISGKIVGIPSWAESLIYVNAFCGSLWNPFLYFLHQFFDNRKNFGKK